TRLFAILELHPNIPRLYYLSSRPKPLLSNFTSYAPPKEISNKCTGTVYSWEMLLVLGSQEVTVRHFSRVVANQRQGYHEVAGDVSYDGITPECPAKHYRGDALYSPKDDTHFPSLSVKHVLAVAAKMRTPQHRTSILSRPKLV
ncbi:hypothetical protein FRC07_007620, partial [Ceratobasidium sp. 392]